MFDCVFFSGQGERERVKAEFDSGQQKYIIFLYAQKDGTMKETAKH